MKQARRLALPGARLHGSGFLLCFLILATLHRGTAALAAVAGSARQHDGASSAGASGARVRPPLLRGRQAAKLKASREPRAAPSVLQANATVADTAGLLGDPGMPLFPFKLWSGLDGADVTVSMDPAAGGLRIDAGASKEGGGIATCSMRDALATTGWIKLVVRTTRSGRVPNDIRMYAAGLAEGLVTSARILEFNGNFYAGAVRDAGAIDAMTGVKARLRDAFLYVSERANLRGGTTMMDAPADPYWRQVRYALLQLWGIRDGYNFAAASKGAAQLSMVDLLLLNSHAELPELLEAFAPDAVARRAAWRRAVATPGGQAAAAAVSKWDGNVTATAWQHRLARMGRGSALVRLAPEGQDLLVGHTTWSDYNKMTRFFKYYDFDLPGAFTAGHSAGFSSYPGCVGSTDHFYMLGSGLAVLGTGLVVLDRHAYDTIVEKAPTPNFLHVTAANRLAKSPSQWAGIFTALPGGLSSAQWLVVDFSRFQKGGLAPASTLWVVEQVAGEAQGMDATSTLNRDGFWASSERPFFARMRELSGHSAAEAKSGTDFAWGSGPRADMFRTLAKTVKSSSELRAVMTNGATPAVVTAPPLAPGAAPVIPASSAGAAVPDGFGVSPRIDLDMASGGLPRGGIDAKVAGRCSVLALQCDAHSGPVHGGVQPAFRWSGNADVAAATMGYPGWPHAGLPNDWNFGWVRMDGDAAAAPAALSDATPVC
eukprot:TRINITY_DN9265_c1_g4_i2.p1 TRINITY_DN9265_c1_g4~~TRINITY_DN9265_c1_g4_i2.p1  ORF type:complete len:712 (+),score=145.84 TRINITY_DN9265_c1_g4_i2:71-2206(+)